MKTYLELAGKRAIEAHNHWHAALSEATEETAKNEARKKGNECWGEAENCLRFYGIGEIHDDDLNSDLDEASDDFERELLDTAPLNFKPLRQAIFLHTFVKVFNRAALLCLILAAGYLWGASNAHDASFSTADSMGKANHSS